MADIQKVIAKNIRYFLKEKHMTQRVLSESINGGRNGLTRVLRGNYNYGISVVTLAQIAEALEVTPGDLVDDWQGEDDDTGS